MPRLVNTLRGMLAYTIWADREVLQVLRAIPAADLERATGSSFGSVLGTMAHILGAEQLWLSRLLGVPLRQLPSLADFPSLDLLAASFEDFWPQLEFYLASLTDEQLEGDFAWTNSRNETHRAPLRQVLLHVVNHSTYHRGQVASQLRQLGHQAPSTDLAYWRGAL
ncbi:MAG: DinB family protein [Thermoanaerobaculia bacterium]|nr:DinB family protein [Thermoanaerobaculia bacterium]